MHSYLRWTLLAGLASSAAADGCAEFYPANSQEIQACRTRFANLIPQKANCTGGIDTPYDSSCYATLNIATWIVNWYAVAPKCDTPTASCCGSSEPWSTCFLRLALGDADFDCTKINSGSCTLEGHHGQSNSTDMPEVHYVVRNIYAVNDFFQNWYLATVFGAGQASNAVPSIVAEVDPSHNADLTLSAILTGLTVGLVMLAAPEVSPFVGTAFEAAGSIALTALTQAPAIAEAIWPQGQSASDQIIQIGNLQSELSNLNANIASMLSAGLSTAMTDVNSFAKFTTGGGFSGPSLIDLPQEVQHIDMAFKTYVLTSALKHNSFIALTGPDYHEDTYFNSTREAQRENFGCNMQANGVCDTVNSRGVYPLCQPEGWSEYTTVSKRSYYLNQEHGRNDIESGILANDIINKGWSTLDLVFDGGWKCSNNEGGGNGQPGVTITDTGLDFSCLSQLPVRSGCQAPLDLDKAHSYTWTDSCPWFYENTHRSYCD